MIRLDEREDAQMAMNFWSAGALAGAASVPMAPPESQASRSSSSALLPLSASVSESDSSSSALREIRSERRSRRKGDAHRRQDEGREA